MPNISTSNVHVDDFRSKVTRLAALAQSLRNPDLGDLGLDELVTYITLCASIKDPLPLARNAATARLSELDREHQTDDDTPST